MNEPRSDAAGTEERPRPASLPEGRYDDVRQVGSTLPGRITAVVLISLAIGLVVAGVYTTYQLTSTPSISGEEVAMTAVDEGRADLSFTVTRDEPGTPVYCIVRAQDESRGEVGRREVFIPPSEHSTVAVETSIATFAPSVIGDVYGCGDDVPDYLGR